MQTVKKYIFVNTQIDQLLDPKIGLFKDFFYTINMTLRIGQFLKVTNQI